MLAWEGCRADDASRNVPAKLPRMFDMHRIQHCRVCGAPTQYRVPVMPSLDGNTVELPTEQLAFTENAVGYSATLSFIRGRVDTLTRALKGE